ncbi:MAG: type VI secretion system protein TssA [Cellvibrionaceae bacterium]
MDQCITDDDIAKFLAPISGDQPAVGDLRENIAPDSSYQILRNARTTARNDERAAQNEGNTSPINAADWSIILNQMPEVLTQQSKDIELTAWYIEALTRNFGFKGLAKGFSLARQLIESYGDQLYPQPDEDGVISQLSSLAGLNGFGSEGALIYPIKAIHITEGDVPGPLAVWQCEQVLEADRITDVEKREARFRQNGITRAQLDDVLAETETSFLQSVRDEIQLAIDEYKQYQQVLDEYSKDDPLPTGQIRDALENSMKVLSYIAGDRLITQPAVEAGSVEAKEKSGGAAKVVTDGPIADREDALQRLREVATYFRRAEPHSPISYSIEQAIRWSGLPLTDLIKELIPDDSARTRYQHLSGIGAIKPEKT